MHGEVRVLTGKPPCQELRLAGPDSSTVEFGSKSAKQFGFAGESGGFTAAKVEINPGDFTHHAQLSSWHPLRVCHSIIPHALAKIFRFPHIDHCACRIA